MADVENMLNGDEVWADTADTPKEGVEQHWKREYLKDAIRDEKLIGGKKRQLIRAHSLVVSDLRSETKGSRFESSCYVCAEVSSLQWSPG